MTDREDAYQVTERSKVRRRQERGVYDRAVVHSILDEALVCHVAFVLDGSPRVIPTAVIRVGEAVYLHGSPSNGLLMHLATGAPACIAVTLIDSIVAGRSGFGCSMDYRSVVIHAVGERVDDEAEKAMVISATVQDIIPGHVVRPPKAKELAATVVLRFPLVEVSAKVRDVGVLDVDEDYSLNAWAGVIPLTVQAGDPVDCPRLPSGIPTPDYAKAYGRGKARIGGKPRNDAAPGAT